jgi:hypothetical protein
VRESEQSGGEGEKDVDGCLARGRGKRNSLRPKRWWVSSIACLALGRGGVCAQPAASSRQQQRGRVIRDLYQNSKQIACAVLACAPSTPCPLFWRACAERIPPPRPSLPTPCITFSHQIEGLALLADALSSPAAVEQTNPHTNHVRGLRLCFPDVTASGHLAYETCFMSTWSDPDHY